MLADLLTTIAWLPLPAATALWYTLNIVLLVFTALLLSELMGAKLPREAMILTFLATFAFVPVLQCLVDGQITIFLLFLWTAALVLLQRRHERAAGAVFALAIAIKLTPALVLLPFVLWRRWRLLGATLLSLCAMGLICIMVNGKETSELFVSKVMPSMSGAIANYTNYSIAAATERLVAMLTVGTVSPFPDHLPATVVLCGRVASVTLLLALAAVLYRQRGRRSASSEIMILGLLGLYAPIISPVSWFHAYATALPAFALLWWEAVWRPTRTAYLLALTAVTLMLGTAVSENLLSTLCLRLPHPALGTVLQFGQLLGAACLVLYRIYRMGQETDSLQGQGQASLLRG